MMQVLILIFLFTFIPKSPSYASENCEACVEMDAAATKFAALDPLNSEEQDKGELLFYSMVESITESEGKNLKVFPKERLVSLVNLAKVSILFDPEKDLAAEIADILIANSKLESTFNSVVSKMSAPERYSVCYEKYLRSAVTENLCFKKSEKKNKSSSKLNKQTDSCPQFFDVTKCLKAAQSRK